MRQQLLRAYAGCSHRILQNENSILFRQGFRTFSTKSIARSPLTSKPVQYSKPVNTTSTTSSSASSSSSSSSSSSRTNNEESIRDAYRSAYRKRQKEKNRTVMLYAAATIVFGVGMTYAAVPLYRMFCAATGYGGTPMTDSHFGKDRLKPLDDDEDDGRRIKVSFNSDVSDALPWSFTPQQKHITVRPGETALAFYTAKNKSKDDIIGIATYNVIPVQMAPYFAKIECFCFDEQKILAGEEVDLPVFFFIDKDFLDDPAMRNIDDIVLSYTFFRAKRNQYGHLVPDEPLK